MIRRKQSQLINGTDDTCKNLMNLFKYKGIENRHEIFDSKGCRHGIKNDKFLLERKQRLEQNIKETTPESKRQNRLKRITTV